MRRPAVFSGAGVLTVYTVDLDKGLPAVDADAVFTDADTVYASPSSLYVATQRYDTQAEYTSIHRFDISDPDRTGYAASGAVPGSLLNQFSLSEDKGVLRAATTVGWGAAAESRVTTLSERGGRLVQRGQVGGLGPGERIFAVRFLGDVGYVVTFRQTDPLYTVDLADPDHPRVRGELKIPGYSAYLHPVGDDLLLGVGQEATDDGRVQGLQLSLFDVSDLARPVRLQRAQLGQRFSSSAVEWDHHAFLWWPATKLALLPIDSEAFTGAGGLPRRAGARHRRGRADRPRRHRRELDAVDRPCGRRRRQGLHDLRPRREGERRSPASASAAGRPSRSRPRIPRAASRSRCPTSPSARRRRASRPARSRSTERQMRLRSIPRMPRVTLR